MKTVELCGPAGSGDHRPEKYRIGLPSFDLIEHLLIVQSKGTAIENRHVRGLLLSNKGSNLSMQRVDRQMSVPPRRPISHRRCDKKKFHFFSPKDKGQEY